jgi:hypothetical protein
MLNLFHSSYFHSIVGIHQDQFEELLKILQQNDKDTTNFSFTPVQRLLLTMIWLRQYPSTRFLAWIFGVDKSTISRTIASMVELMWTSLQSKLEFPGIKTCVEHGRRLGKYFVTVVVDGSEQQILESVNTRKKNVTFSGKKKFHTFTKLIAVLPNGKFVFMSPSQPGKYIIVLCN